MSPAERQTRALCDALYPGAAISLVRVDGGYAVRVLRLTAPRPEAARTPDGAWRRAVEDLRAAAQSELAAVAARVDRIGKALEVE